MKKFLLIGVAVIIHATTLNKLFTAIKKAPQTKIDNVLLKQIKTAKKEIKSSLYPTISLISSFTHYSNYTSIRPLPPTESAKLLKTNGDLPFSQNIARVGFLISMPLFVKEIYDNEKKVSILTNSLKLKAKLNLIKREALVVGYVSKLNYLYALKKAILHKKDSIITTLKAIKVGVDNGVIPKFKLLRLEDKLNQISININNIDSNINTVKSKIYALTKIEINEPINFTILPFEKKEFFSLKILKNNLEASKKDLEAKKDYFFPKILLKAQGNRAFAKSYNTNNHIALNYASVGIYLKWDIFNKKNRAEIQKSKLDLLKNSLEIEKTKNELIAKSKELLDNLKLINNSIKKTENSILLKKRLLEDAKIAFKLNRMSVDDYLRYEDDLSLELSNLAKLKALRNIDLLNLAVIYGKNIERICK